MDDTAEFDLERNPHPYWATGRRECPIEHHEVLGFDNYSVLCDADVRDVLRRADSFSSSINQDTIGPYMGPLMLAKDGAEHQQYRQLVSHAFRKAALDRWEHELIRPIIADVVGAIAPLGRADLVVDLTSRYPVQVIAGIVGVPVDDHEQFQEWAEAITAGPMDHDRAMAASEAMRAYLEPLVAARRAEPQDDLISDIVTAEIDGARLDDEHVYGFLRLLMPAGAETTFHAMGSLLLALLTHPEDLARVRADRSLMANAIEETLRWEAPVTMVNRRTTAEVELGRGDHARTAPAGSSVLLLTSSANRDETVYDDPAEWSLERGPTQHLAFGFGRHLCLGMHLARLELSIGLEAVLDGLPNLRLDPDEPVPEVVGHAFRGPERLPVLFDPVA